MIYSHNDQEPDIHFTVFIAPTADIVGNVKIDQDSSVWFQTVIRGDVNWVQIGKRTNVQDSSTLHVTRRDSPLKIGSDVTVGHRALLHGCTIQDRVLVGMGAIIMDHAEIGEDSVVGAGALITQNKKFPPRSVIMGSPAKRVREATDEEIAFIKKSAQNYVGDAKSSWKSL